MEQPPEQRKLKDIIRELAEASSLHGIPRILASRQIAVKFLWFLLLVGASALFGYQMYGLFILYYSYPVKTSVSLQYDMLRLPAITICNMNPVKQHFFNTSLFTNGTISSGTDSATGVNPTAGGDTTTDGSSDYVDHSQDYSNQYERALSSSKDVYSTWRKNIIKKIKNLDQKTRSLYGDRRDEFILKSTFRGFYLKRDICITEVMATNYGNCYEIDSPDFVARATGPDEGHELTLFLDIDQYAENITTGFGVRLVIHEPGTLPMPDVEGLTLNAGFETNVGIKLTHYDRLGGLYDECDDGMDFYEETGLRYSVPVCQAKCQLDHVAQECECIPLFNPDAFVNYTDMTEGLSICSSVKHEICQDRVISNIRSSDMCHCARQCSEDFYTTTISSRAWPSPAYLQNVLRNETCTLLHEEGVHRSECDSSNSTESNTYNYVKINIYYEDLNYDEILEEPLYDTLRFLSDIGGAMGLYMGASLLTYMELLQLLLEVGIYMQKRIASRMQKTTIDIVKN